MLLGAVTGFSVRWSMTFRSGLRLLTTATEAVNAVNVTYLSKVMVTFNFRLSRLLRRDENSTARCDNLLARSFGTRGK